MALRQLAGGDQAQHVVGQLEQADRVGDRGPAAADAACDLGLGQVELVGEDGVRPRQLDGVQILAGHVLGQRKDQRLALVGLADDRPGSSRGRPGAPPASAARRR